MNILPYDRQVQAIAALTEGVSIRATERLTDTIMRLGVKVGVERRDVFGKPIRISTSYVERSNLTVRMQQRRFTRLTNGFSKKLDNHIAAVGLFVAHYNLCRVHEALRMTPAMALGVTDHIWTIGELIEASTEDLQPQRPGTQHGRFRVIDGGSR